MAAMARLHLLYPPTIFRPSLLFLKPSLSPPASRIRKLSTFPRLCSSADQTPQSASSSAALSGSIVGDVLDYLNESWTQFHATADAKRQLINAGFDLLNEMMNGT